MRKTLPWLALLLALSACDETLSGELDRDSLVMGAWTLSHREVTNDCVQDADVFPVAPGPVDIRLVGDVVSLTSPGEMPLAYEIEPQGWSRVRSETLDGCDLSLQETWHFQESSPSRLSATYESRLELAGDCGFTGLQSCRVGYTVWGVRR